jgi:uncharacterized NAD(P)/FAD-binding protein YdhS
MTAHRPHAPRAAAGGRPIAVIGAGFTGTMVAIHLESLLAPAQPLLLCERGAFARGTAYATPNAHHMLNVRAANMSAFPGKPGHFQDWLRAAAPDCPEAVRNTDAGIFASRGMYGRYLGSLLDESQASPNPSRVELIADEAVDLEPDGDGYRLSFASGATRLVGGVVLAVGNVAAAADGSPAYRPNPWDPDSTADLHADLPVLIMGTGLTMVDLALELRSKGFPGPVIAISRRGLLPHRHAVSARWPTPSFGEAASRPLLEVVRQVQREVRQAQDHGIDWRGVVDSLRPITAALWQSLSWDDRARFLRHLRPFWDVHRHRIAEPVAAQVDALRGEGFLVVRRGRITDMDVGDDRATVTYRLRATGQEQRVVVQRVINATGLASLKRANSLLVQSLLRRGLIRLDPLQLGLDVTGTLQAIASDGTRTRNLWALGPLVRGVFWECVAVPDIRMQAERVARVVASMTAADTATVSGATISGGTASGAAR